LPNACHLTPPALLRDALRVRTRCGVSGALDLDVEESEPAPSDFEVKLRRGRSLAPLDAQPRYSVAIARSGVVRFEGQHRVSARGSSEGRTSTAMLAALWGHVSRLGWSARAASESERCLGDERGDIITLHANGQARTVRDRAGCRGGFSSEELARLLRAIERVAGVEAWTAPRFPIFSRDAEVWVVAAE
jgi:hypothetical protein